MSEEEEDAALNAPLTPEMAEQLGISYDPEKPPTMGAMLHQQFASTLMGFKQTSNENNEIIKRFRQKISGETDSKLSPQQKLDRDQLFQAIELYPELLEPTKLFAATLLRRTLDQEKLLSRMPGNRLDIMDEIETLLRSKIPEDQWPENAPAEVV